MSLLDPPELLGQTRADGGGGAGLGEEGEQRTVATVDHHRLGKVAHQRQVVQGLRGAVHRVDRRSEGQPCLQPLLGHVRHRRHRQADFLGDIADDDPGAAADGDHAEAVAHRIDTPGGEVGDVHQFLGGPGADHRIVAQHGVQHLVVAGQRSGVGQRRAATQGAAPDLVQDHRLAGAMRGLQGGEEAVDVADGFGVGHHHVDLRRLHQPADAVAQGDVGLVTGGHADRGSQAALARHAEQVRAVCAGLGGDAYPAGQRYATFQAGGEERVVTEVTVERAQRIRTEQTHTVLAGSGYHRILHRRAGLADLAESGREHDGTARPLAAQCPDGLQHLRRRHRDNGRVRCLRQLRDAGEGR